MLETILQDKGYHVTRYGNKMEVYQNGKFQAELTRYDRRSKWEIIFFKNKEVVNVINKAVQ